MLKFSSGEYNRKLRSLAEHLNIPYCHVQEFSLPAGFTCPAATICKTYATKKTGRIIDGKQSTIRCYAASMESRYKNVRRLHWSNYDALRGLSTYAMKELILSVIPKHTEIIRIHVSGDFFNWYYFQAWCKVAMERHDIIFFGYTKILHYVLADKPDNLHLIYSHGSIYDQEADKLDIAQVYIVQSVNTAIAPIICNHDKEYEDFNYILNKKSFSILIHGTQKRKIK